MKVFIDFENAILNNGLKLEVFFAAFRKYGFSCCRYIKGFALESLPYSAKTFAMLKDNYAVHSNTFHILFRPENKIYVEKFYIQLKDDFPTMELIPIVAGDKLKTINNVTNNNYAYVGSSLADWQIFRKAEESCFVGNVFSTILYWLLVKKSKDSRVNFFNGLISLFFSHFQILVPIFSIWPAWLEVNEHIINLAQIKATFISTLGFMSFMSLLKSLGNLDRERAFFQRDIEPLSSREFIEGSAKLTSALIISSLFFLFGCYGVFTNVIGGLKGLFLSLVYFVFSGASFWKKWSRTLLIFFLVGVFSNLTFAKKLFKIL